MKRAGWTFHPLESAGRSRGYGVAEGEPGGGSACVVVVVAELFVAQAWTATLASVDEDVAAVVAFGCLRGHKYPSPKLSG